MEEYLHSRATGPEQLADCRTIEALCRRVTNQPPRMFGPSIVGYGRYSYRYETGHSGEAPVAGFAIRGRELVVYVAPEAPGQAELLARLGPHKMGKSCLYLRRLSEVDLKVLEEILATSVAETRRRYGATT
ncbi:MAG: DUF1801 domain-containing protein [Verrucomicrobia bacterium]|nr:DUF1801 domain-containing protein [Verrucomicrobiota bacterium]